MWRANVLFAQNYRVQIKIKEKSQLKNQEEFREKRMKFEKKMGSNQRKKKSVSPMHSAISLILYSNTLTPAPNQPWINSLTIIVLKLRNCSICISCWCFVLRCFSFLSLSRCPVRGVHMIRVVISFALHFQSVGHFLCLLCQACNLSQSGCQPNWVTISCWSNFPLSHSHS